MKQKGAIFRILAFILIYLAGGVLLLVYGSAMQDNFPQVDAKGSYFQEQLKLEVKNEAPLSLPLIGPDFAGYVRLTRASKGATCRVKVQSGWKNCETTQVEIGRIAPGKAKAMVFSIDPQGGDFDAVVSAYPKMLAGLPDSVRGLIGCSRSVECTYTPGTETYVCS